MPAYNEITPKSLYRLVGTPEAPVIVDLRIDEDFNDDPRLIPGAFRHSHQHLDQLVHVLSKGGDLASGKVVVYCQKGRKISQGAAALLRHWGFPVEVLEGGQFGWRDAALPMVCGPDQMAFDFRTPTRWVTRHRPKIDRIACPWLIRRFIDPAAQFLFVPPKDVPLVAEKFQAIPFDIEDVPFSHRGDLCTFDVLLDQFDLRSPTLEEVALIVRGADTNRHDLAPQASGLLAFSVGLSRMYKDDLKQMEAGMALYDALYRWARDGRDEGHDWPAGGVGS